LYLILCLLRCFLRAREDTEFWLFIANLFSLSSSQNTKQKMPLKVHRQNVVRNTEFVIWNATESMDELHALARLSENEVELLDSILLEKRKREWLTTRILLQIVASGSELSHLSNGKPILTNHRGISISHCDNLAGVIVSDEMVGLDIQRLNEKIKRIARKFCHSDEITRALESADELTYLTMVWSAKEAVFKYFGERIQFAEEMRMAHFDVHDSKLELSYDGIHGSKRFTLVHDFIDNFHVIYTE
jgi:4'-phosphopantetheinyl transferase